MACFAFGHILSNPKDLGTALYKKLPCTYLIDNNNNIFYSI